MTLSLTVSPVNDSVMSVTSVMSVMDTVNDTVFDSVPCH